MQILTPNIITVKTASENKKATQHFGRKPECQMQFSSQRPHSIPTESSAEHKTTSMDL